MQLADMRWPEFPVALGVIRRVCDGTYDERVDTQACEVAAKSKIRSMDELLHSGATWEV